MGKLKPYLSFSHPSPGPTSFLFKKAAEKNAAFMCEQTIADYREAMERLADVRVISPGTRLHPTECAGVPCEWVYRDASPCDRVILYLHGGSWTYGTLRTARPVGMQLNNTSGYRVLAVQYRLSPEHPYPAGADDCALVYRSLLEAGFSPSQIGIFGDSAGGNLALSLIQRLIAQSQPLPAALGLASPATDLTASGTLERGNLAQLYAQHEGRKQSLLSLYCGDFHREDPLLSPVYGELSALPPTLVHVGQDEELCIDCDVFAQKAFDLGVDISLKIWRGMHHDFTIVGATLKESRQSLQEFGYFFRQHIS